MKTTITIALIYLVSLSSFSQPTIEWQKSLGGSLWDDGTSIQQTSDNGYIVAGYSFSNDGDLTNNFGARDYWVIKLTEAGVIEWQNSYGGSGDDFAWSIQQTLDGGYIVAGYSDSIDGDVTGNHGGDDSWVLKLTPIGDIEWQKSLGGSQGDWAYSIQQTLDGGYIVAGGTRSNDGDVTGNHGSSDFWVVKLTIVGVIEWQKTYGGSSSEGASSIQQTGDGGYIVAGASQSIDGDVTGVHGGVLVDFWVVKLSTTGVIEWQKALGGTDQDYASSVKQTLDGGYIVAGATWSNDGDVTINNGEIDYWVIKLNSSGTLMWQKSLGGSSFDTAFSVDQTEDGGYVVAGRVRSSNGDVTGHHGWTDSWLVKLSSSGVLVWQKAMGGSYGEDGRSVQQTEDGGFIVAGLSGSMDGDVTGNHGVTDFWVVKLSPVLGVAENDLNQSVILSPNPNNGRFSLGFSEEIEITAINVIDALGKTVYSETNIPSETFTIDQNFTTGVYFVNIISTTSETTLKMIVE